MLEAGVGMMAFVVLVGVATYEISDMRARGPKVERAHVAALVAKTPARPLAPIALKVAAAPRPQIVATSALALALEAAAATARRLAPTPVPVTAEPAAKPPAAVEAKAEPAAPEDSESVAEAKIPPWPYASPDDAAQPQQADALPAAPETAESVAEVKTPSIDPMATGTISRRAGRHAAERTLRAKPGHGARARHLALCRTHSSDIPSTKSTLPRVSSNP
jgi:hypothetical protein